MLESSDATTRIPVSVLVLTHNEEVNVGQCLESLGWADEILLVDSLSTDRTVEIADRLGAKVYFRPFEGYATQRNWALDNLPFRNDWILVLDADELIPAPLAHEIAEAIKNPPNGYMGFYLNRRFFFLGRWLKHGGYYPSWILRLFKRDAGRFEDRPMDEHLLLKGEAGYLRQPFDHPDRRELSHWISKHNRYADLKAEEFMREKFGGGYENTIECNLKGDQPEKKRWVKLHLWNRLPLLLRPFLLFFRNYFFLGGFLDGRAGFIYHVLWSFWYPFLIDVKILDKKRSRPKAGAAYRGSLP